MIVKWVLLLVTVIAPAEYDVERLSVHDTMSNCYVAATERNLWQEPTVDQELLCIKVRGNNV